MSDIFDASGVRIRILIPFSIVIILIALGSLVGLQTVQSSELHETLEQQIGRVQASMGSEIELQATFLQGQLDGLLLQESLRIPYEARSRDALLAAADPLFQQLKSRYNVTHFYFIQPNRNCFLRVHNPAKFDDAINRWTTLEAERTGKPAYGIEFGASGVFTLRVVNPWVVNGQLIGYLELGKEIHEITQDLKQNLGSDLIYVARKDTVTQETWEAGLATFGKTASWDQFADYVVIDQTTPDIPAGVQQDWFTAEARAAEQTHSLAIQERTANVRALPLSDASGKDIGAILVLQDVTASLQRSGDIARAFTVFGVVVAGVVFIFLWWFLGRIQKRLMTANQELQQVNSMLEQRAAVEQEQRLNLEQVNAEIERRAAVEQGQRQQLQALVDQIRDASAGLNTAATEIMSITNEQMSGATSQEAALTQTAATVEQMRVTVSRMSEHARSVAENARQSIQVSRSGQSAVADSLQGMEMIRQRVQDIATTILTLSGHTQQIGEIVETVNQLADQSKLLALNASIEAARAGQEGAGFAVVAMEVRQLAEQSRDATSRIRAILGQIQQATNSAVMVTEEGSKGADNGVSLVSRAGDAIQHLAATIEESAQTADAIAGSIQQQLSGMEQLSQAMASLKQTSSRNTSGTRQAERSAAQLSSLATDMQQTIAAFQKADEAPVAVRKLTRA